GISRNLRVFLGPEVVQLISMAEGGRIETETVQWCLYSTGLTPWALARIIGLGRNTVHAVLKEPIDNLPRWGGGKIDEPLFVMVMQFGSPDQFTEWPLGRF